MTVEPTPLSAHNPRLADLRRLTGRRRSRVEAGRYVIEGPVPIVEMLTAGVPVHEVFVDAGEWSRAEERSPLRTATRLALDADVPVWGLADGVVASVADTDAPQGVIAVAPRVTVGLDRLMGETGPVLVLVDVADPGNVGTLVRTAEAAGAVGVVVTGSTADPFGPKAVRAAAGSAARVPIAEVTEAADVLQAAASAARPTVATVVDGGDAPEVVDLTGSVCLLVGSEARGLDAATVAACTTRLTLPMAGSVESVNVAVAGAVVMFEIARQRRAR